MTLGDRIVAAIIAAAIIGAVAFVVKYGGTQ